MERAPEKYEMVLFRSIYSFVFQIEVADAVTY